MPTDNRISQMQFGGHSMSMPIPADYDGDGYADLALHDPRNRKFHILNSSGSNYNSVNGNGEQLISLLTTQISRTILLCPEIMTVMV